MDQAAYHKTQLDLQRELESALIKVAPHLTDDELHLMSWALSIPYMRGNDATQRNHQ
jgi:hypothetical protein